MTARAANVQLDAPTFGQIAGRATAAADAVR
jgi:hypothetical protein